MIKFLILSLLISLSSQYTRKSIPSTFRTVTHKFDIFNVDSNEQSLRSGRILNGTSSSTNQYPFATFIHVGRPSGTVFCSGSILASDWVLTSRSCFVFPSNQQGTSFRAFAGSMDHQSTNMVSSLARFGAWIDDSLGNHPNFALFALSNALSLSNAIRPIRVPRLSQTDFGFDDFNITTVGWGRMSNGAFPRILQFGRFRILAAHLCFWNIQFSSHNFCSQHQTLNSMISPERGEGGASIITENDGQITLIGVTSNTFTLPNGIAASNVRISSFLWFIEDHTGITYT